MFQIEFDKKEIESALTDYEYIKKLGSGAFASVHLVQHRQTGHKFALKKISCFGMGEYEKAGAANEVRILSSLDHKNIIKVNECLFDNSEDILYIFMEYAESGDLTGLIQQAKDKKKRLPENTIWKVISDISDGLQYMHRAQIIHRDLKPANIFRSGKCFKIGDMNVSKVLKNGAIASTKTGSPLYSAPEVWQSQQYDNKCDIWSLGVLVYELCALRVPFEAQTIQSLISKMKNDKPKPLPTLYSASLDDLVKKMLRISPVERLSAEQVFKIASEKLHIETAALEGVQNMMDTIVFPDSHQRWVNLIPSFLPPKTSRRESSSSNIQERNLSKSREKGSGLMENNSGIFRTTQRKPINLPKSKSRSRIEHPSEVKIPTNLPPIYKSNSPVAERKGSEQKHKNSQNRQHSSSSRPRKPSIEYVKEAKIIISNDRSEYN